MAANPTSLTPPDKYNKFRGRPALNNTLSCSLTTARVAMGWDRGIPPGLSKGRPTLPAPRGGGRLVPGASPRQGPLDHPPATRATIGFGGRHVKTDPTSPWSQTLGTCRGSMRPEDNQSPPSPLACWRWYPRALSWAGMLTGSSSQTTKKRLRPTFSPAPHPKCYIRRGESSLPPPSRSGRKVTGRRL